MPDKFERFTERARKVLTYAQEEAHRFGHNYIGTEHLLLGLVREGDGVAARVLVTMDVTLPKTRKAVEFIVGRGDSMAAGEIGLTPRAKTVMELAVDEARRLNHHYIGTEHLLLGLLREGEGIAVGVLESMGANLEKVRGEVLALVGNSPRTTPAVPIARARQGRSLDTARLALIVAVASVLASLLTRQRLNLSAALITGALAAWAIGKVGGKRARGEGRS